MLNSNNKQGGKAFSFNHMESVTMEREKKFGSYNNILLIEDNLGDARLVELLLGESDLPNCKVTIKTTLEDGIAALKEDDNYAVILLDLSLPDSQGFETLEHLISEFPNNNVIVLTGFSDKELGLRAVKAGAQDFLVKGDFDGDTLSKSLRYSIERSNVLKRLEETQRLAKVGSWTHIPEKREFNVTDELYRIFDMDVTSVFDYNLIEDEQSPFYLFREIQDELTDQRSMLKKDFEIKTIKGEQRYVFIQCHIEHGNDGYEMHGIIQDITERKKAAKELDESQARYQDIFSKSKDAILICSMDGKFIDFNQATTQLFHKTKVELQEENFHSLIGPIDEQRKYLKLLADNQTIKDFAVEIEREDGEIRHCLVTANPLDSYVNGYNAIVRDVTDRKEAEELTKSRDMAKQSAEMKEQFIANVSHEMRTPMNAILGMSNLVIKTDLNEEQYNYISSIKKSSEILLGIVNDILEISTLQKGKLQFDDKTFDLHELLGNLVSVMNYKVKEKNLKLEMSYEKNLPKYVKGDPLRLNQILYNLVGNAVKFTDNGYVRIKVESLNQTESIAQLKFIVEDTGIGMPKDKLNAIFETFTRIRSKERLFEGTGLGLSIAKNLVENQGGRIGVESEMGKGSTFFFDLIFEMGEMNEIIPNEEDGVDFRNMDRPVRLLLVEDHKMNQLVARKTLEKQWPDMDITIADNGKIAIDMLKEKTFDIILMDIQMPVMDGYEATKFIREQMPKAIAELPILAMTAHAYVSKDEKFREIGMDDFVLKPFDPEQLFQKIVKYINIKNRSTYVNEC